MPLGGPGPGRREAAQEPSPLQAPGAGRDLEAEIIKAIINIKPGKHTAIPVR